MDKIQKLKEELRRLEIEPIIENLKKQKEKLDKEYVGKVFASHSFSRRLISSSGKLDSSIRIMVVRVKEAVFSRNSFFCYDSYSRLWEYDASELKEFTIKFKCDRVIISTSEKRIQLEKDVVLRRNEIPEYLQKLEVFNNLAEKVKRTIKEYLSTETSALKVCLHDYSDIEENCSDRIDSLKTLGYNLVQLESNEYYEVCRWHPFCYRDLGIVVSAESLRLLEIKIKEVQEKINRSLSSLYCNPVYDRELKVLESVRNKIKKNLAY